MYYQKGCVRIIVHVSSYRYLMLLLSAITIASFIIYLQWLSPAEQRTLHRTLRKIKSGENSASDFHGTLISADSGQPVRSGNGAWVTDRYIQIMSAIHDIHHPQTLEKRIILTAFLRHTSKREFVCCFHSSEDSKGYIQIPANLDFIDVRFVVDLQNALFECRLPSWKNEVERPDFVSFAPSSCGKSMSAAVHIVYPVSRSWEYAVCTKVAYGHLDPSHLLEWFEYMRVIGASKIVSFHNNLHPDTQKVFDYYIETGYLELIEYHPRVKDGQHAVPFTEESSQTHQARQDKTLVVRDCQYRLAGYDFVLTIDFDELPVPIQPLLSLNWALQTVRQNFSDGAAFRMDPILLPKEWQKSKLDLYHWRFSSGTSIAPYCVKWAYIPSRTWLAMTHEIVPKKGYKTYVISQDILHFLHFRTCKVRWQTVRCQNLTPTIQNEHSLKHYAAGVLRNLRKLPLEQLIPDANYVDFVRRDPRGRSQN